MTTTATGSNSPIEPVHAMSASKSGSGDAGKISKEPRYLGSGVAGGAVGGGSDGEIEGTDECAGLATATAEALGSAPVAGGGDADGAGEQATSSVTIAIPVSLRVRPARNTCVHPPCAGFALRRRVNRLCDAGPAQRARAA